MKQLLVSLLLLTAISAVHADQPLLAGHKLALADAAETAEVVLTGKFTDAGGLAYGSIVSERRLKAKVTPTSTLKGSLPAGEVEIDYKVQTAPAEDRESLPELNHDYIIFLGEQGDIGNRYAWKIIDATPENLQAVQQALAGQ